MSVELVSYFIILLTGLYLLGKFKFGRLRPGNLEKDLFIGADELSDTPSISMGSSR